MTTVYVIQHAEKQRESTDPGLTERGHEQAQRTADALRDTGFGTIYASPLRRAQETAAPLARATGRTVLTDARIHERMNWDGTQTVEDFLADWDRATEDRDFTPQTGDSSRTAGARFHDFLDSLPESPLPVAVVTHGGVTVDLLRTLLGDDAVAPDLVANGVPSCAVTTLRRIGGVWTVQDIAASIG